MKKRIKSDDIASIQYLYYKSIEAGFYEVYAITHSNKIAIEGNMCIGVLSAIMDRVSKEGGVIKKVRYNLVNTRLKDEVKMLRKELTRTYSLIKKINKITK